MCVLVFGTPLSVFLISLDFNLIDQWRGTLQYTLFQKQPRSLETLRRMAFQWSVYSYFKTCHYGIVISNREYKEIDFAC